MNQGPIDLTAHERALLSAYDAIDRGEMSVAGNHGPMEIGVRRTFAMGTLGVSHAAAELATAIAQQAQALADGTVVGPRYSQVLKIAENVATLLAWTADDRPRPPSLGSATVRSALLTSTQRQLLLAYHCMDNDIPRTSLPRDAVAVRAELIELGLVERHLRPGQPQLTDAGRDTVTRLQLAG